MKIKVSHHIFASLKGYQTQFRSSNVTNSENAELESFSFGQTNDLDYILSLHNHPAYLIRKLKSGRWAITRVFEGANDEYGRITLLFHSILVDRNGWINQLGCDVQPLLDHPTLWKRKEESEISVAIDPSPLPDEIKMEVNAIISKLMNTDQSLILDEPLCSLQTIRWVNRLLPDELKEKFTCGYRVLSDNFPASLLCLSELALRGSLATAASYNNSVARRAPLYAERSDWHDGHRETNKTAIIIICVASVLGVLGIIFISLRISDLQYKKVVEKINTKARSFLDENSSISGDPLSWEQKEKDATKLIEQIKKILSKKPNAELDKTLSLLKEWQGHAKSEGQKDVKVKSQIKQLEAILDKNTTIYPASTDILNVLSIKKNLTPEPNDLISQQTEAAFKKIKAWLGGHEKHLNEIEDKINDIKTEISRNDPNQYAGMDPNQYRFGSAEPNLPDYADPNQFSIKADQNIQRLYELKRKIQGVRNEPSWANAKNSPISDDKEKAEEILGKITNLNTLATQYIQRFNILKYFATDIRKFEDDLSKGVSGNETDVFINALNNYDTKARNATDKIQKILLRHCFHKLANYFEHYIKPKMRVAGGDKIKETLCKSSLSKEEPFRFYCK
jgi:hypothetical protein